MQTARPLDAVQQHLKELEQRERPSQLLGQILVAVDHSKQAAWAVELAARLAHAHQSRLILLHVVFIPPLQPELGYIEPSGREDCFREAQQLLEDVKSQLPEDVHVETVLREGDAANEICKAAQLFGADLIVMGTHGRGAFGRMILGSVANTVIRKSACPVLTVANAPPTDPHATCERLSSSAGAVAMQS